MGLLLFPWVIMGGQGGGAETAEGYESEADEGGRVAKAEGLAHEQPDLGLGRLDECVGQAEGGVPPRMGLFQRPARVALEALVSGGIPPCTPDTTCG